MNIESEAKAKTTPIISNMTLTTSKNCFMTIFSFAKQNIVFSDFDTNFAVETGFSKTTTTTNNCCANKNNNNNSDEMLQNYESDSNNQNNLIINNSKQWNDRQIIEMPIRQTNLFSKRRRRQSRLIKSKRQIRAISKTVCFRQNIANSVAHLIFIVAIALLCSSTAHARTIGESKQFRSVLLRNPTLTYSNPPLDLITQDDREPYRIPIASNAGFIQQMQTPLSLNDVIRDENSFDAANLYDSKDLAQFQGLERDAFKRPMEKRRLVVRVPFAQNPDTVQMSRIYKSLFTEQKQKKHPFTYSIRHFIL